MQISKRSAPRHFTNALAAAALATMLASCSHGPGWVAAHEAPPPPPPAPPPPPPPPPPASYAPVQARAPSTGDSIIVTGSRVRRSDVDSNSPITSVGTGALESNLNKLPQYTPAPAPPAKVAGYAQYIPPVVVATDPDNEQYAGQEVSPIHLSIAEPVSTFSVDVDTGSYANTRRFLTMGSQPPRGAVRTEEMINYFRYDYDTPTDRSTPFTVSTEVSTTPWNPETRLLRIGLRGYDLPRAERPAANLVFLIDVSGSMGDEDKLPLVKAAMSKLADNLSAKDKVSIVVYAGAAGLVLQPTSSKAEIRRALDQLESGGSTAGGAGIQLAYQIAGDNRIEGGVNRVILCTDGDFNVGISDNKALIEMVEKQRDSGITLTALGFGTGNYNEAMMEQIADHGNGNYAYIDSALEAEKVLADEMSSTLFTIAKDVKIQVEFNPAKVTQYRLIGYENRILREEDFNNDKVDAGDIGAGHQVTAIYEIVPTGTHGWVDPRRYQNNPDADQMGQDEIAFVKLRYKLPDGQTSKLIERSIPSRAMDFAKAPQGDMAFAVAVAAYGQKLRGDPLMGDFAFADVIHLAGDQKDYWRQEFVRLASLAGGLD